MASRDTLTSVRPGNWHGVFNANTLIFAARCPRMRSGHIGATFIVGIITFTALGWDIVDLGVILANAFAGVGVLFYPRCSSVIDTTPGFTLAAAVGRVEDLIWGTNDGRAGAGGHIKQWVAKLVPGAVLRNRQ